MSQKVPARKLDQDLLHLDLPFDVFPTADPIILLLRSYYPIIIRHDLLPNGGILQGFFTVFIFLSVFFNSLLFSKKHYYCFSAF